MEERGEATVVAGTGTGTGTGTGVVPFRQRHDGWTPERRAQFLERLAETGCVRAACKTVGLSKTSGYRAYARMPDFAAAWDRALAMRRPMLEDAAFERATRGVTVPLFRNGKVVGHRQRYSDGLLQFLLQRGDRREAAEAKAAAEVKVIEASREPSGTPTKEEMYAAPTQRLDAHEAHMKRVARAKALAFADRMQALGKAP